MPFRAWSSTLAAGAGSDAIAIIVRGVPGWACHLASPKRGAGAPPTRAIAEGLLAPEDTGFPQRPAQPLSSRSKISARLYDAMDNATRNRRQAAHGRRRSPRAVTSRIAPASSSIEDVHWADDRVLAHLAELTAAVVDCPAVLVIVDADGG